jgi:hypothetical protein
MYLYIDLDALVSGRPLQRLSQFQQKSIAAAWRSDHASGTTLNILLQLVSHTKNWSSIYAHPKVVGYLTLCQIIKLGQYTNQNL